MTEQTPIPITRTLFGVEEEAAVADVLRSGWVLQGRYVAEFERKFTEYTGAPYAVATSNCTTALQIAVAALGLKPGDEVIVPSFTWISTPNAVEYMGAKAVFCDIDLATYNINVDAIDELITPNTVGIIPVHLFGLCANMDAVLDIARHHKLWVVEDAACAFGSWYRGVHAGTLGDAGCFSFHPRKSITTGEGGMITTTREDINQLSRTLRDHGASRGNLERHQGKAGFLLSEYNHLGYNYRLTDIQGAIGSIQMDRAAGIMEERHRAAAYYDQQLAGLSWLETPVTPSDMVHGYQSYVCLFRPEAPSMDNVERLNEQRNRLMQSLEEQGIATRQGTHAPPLLGYYAQKYDLHPEQFPNAYLAEQLTLALPLYPQMTEADQDRVVAALQTTFEGIMAPHGN